MQLQPVARRALLAAFNSPGRSLRRIRGGFTALPTEVQAGGSSQTEVFTRRCVNWLDVAGLVAFDHRDCPSQVTVNSRGVAYAEQLIADQAAKAGAP